MSLLDSYKVQVSLSFEGRPNPEPKGISNLRCQRLWWFGLKRHSPISFGRLLGLKLLKEENEGSPPCGGWEEFDGERRDYCQTNEYVIVALVCV